MQKKEVKRRSASPGEDAFLIQIHSGRKVIFEACKRILEFTDERIVLEGKMRVKITGRNLRLKELGGGNLGVVGRVDTVEFLRGGVHPA